MNRYPQFWRSACQKSVFLDFHGRFFMLPAGAMTSPAPAFHVHVYPIYRVLVFFTEKPPTIWPLIGGFSAYILGRKVLPTRYQFLLHALPSVVLGPLHIHFICTRDCPRLVLILSRPPETPRSVQWAFKSMLAGCAGG